jgi:nudix motif 8
MQKIIIRNFSTKFHKIFNDQEIRTKSLEHFKKTTKINIYKKKQEKRSAILIPVLFNEDNNVSLLYTVRSVISNFPLNSFKSADLSYFRSTNLRTHKGQVSFPGGIFDDEDQNSAINCALRETHEEIGIEKDVSIEKTLKSSQSSKSKSLPARESLGCWR